MSVLSPSNIVCTRPVESISPTYYFLSQESETETLFNNTHAAAKKGWRHQQSTCGLQIERSLNLKQCYCEHFLSSNSQHISRKKKDSWHHARYLQTHRTMCHQHLYCYEHPGHIRPIVCSSSNLSGAVLFKIGRTFDNL